MHFRKSHVRAKKLDVQETDVSFSQFHRSCEIISLDACLRMDGIPALDLWDLVKEVFHFPKPTQPHQRSSTGNLSRHQTSTPKTKPGFQHDNFDLNNVDCVPSNAKFSRFGAMLYIFEDSEAVIKMIIKGRCPRMRYVSRTHRVALDWLFDRINLDPKFRLKYVDTKNQHADVLRKGISHVMSGTIFFICLTSAISALSAALRISA